MATAMEASVMVSAAAEGADAGGAGGAMWAMLDELVWFAAGFAVIRILMHLGLMPQWRFGFPSFGGGKSGDRASQRRGAIKALCAAASAGQGQEVVGAWDREKVRGPFPVDALKDSAQALAQLAPERFAADFAAHLARYQAAYPQPKTMNLVIDAAVQAGRPDLAAGLVAGLQQRLGVQPDARTRGILSGDFAAKGDAAKVHELEAEAFMAEGELTARGCLLAIKGHLKNGKPDEALQRMLSMRARGLEVPPRALTELFKVACRLGPCTIQQALDGVRENIELPAESVAVLLLDCLQREDVQMARRLDALIHSQGTALQHGVYEPLLKLYAKSCDARALELLQHMQLDGFFASEGLCGSLLARCAESQNLRFAEAIAAYLRGRSMMTLAIFKTLMKVYACCGRYDSACDLYGQVLAAGLEPDHVMYGCLVKFAVKSGRAELSRELFDKARGGDVQNYMWLIRAAGREGNVDRALELLRQLEATRTGALDVAIYNCALDACVTNGRMSQARELLAEISRAGLANLVTYNTLMKGACAQGDLQGARRVLGEMEAAGHRPDSASYNCLLGSAVSAGSFGQVWALLEEMDRKYVRLDHFTVSIMMKAAKRARDPRDASRALAVLDRATGVSVCEDDVVFNTVLDACIHRRDTVRLAGVLAAFEASSMKPSVHSYGLLVRAHSMLKQPARCWALWRQMVEERAITPNTITLSCMLDAVICSGQLEEAVALFRTWKTQVPPNTVMYSTLIKGFAGAGDAARAMDMYHELRSEGLQMNLVAYTTLIDAQARAGDMAQARRVFQQMEQDGCEPNVITFSAMVKGHCLQGDLGEALRVFQAMLDRGLAADAVIFNTLLDGCVKHSRFELADSLLADMAKYSVEPSNFTLSIVVKMWGKRRRLDKAFEAVRASLGAARQPLDTQVGNCLISACFHNQAASRALEAFAGMKAWRGCSGPDAGTYSTLIAGLARHGECRKAVQLAQEACELAMAPRPSVRPLSPESLRLLSKALQQHGLMQELGEPLFRRLRAAGMQVADNPCVSDGPARRYTRGL